MTRANAGPSSSSRTTPSIHVRVALTWLAIFPLVAIGSTAMAPFTVGWDPVLRAFVLTLLVVPLAMYVVVPWLMRIRDARQGRAPYASDLVTLIEPAATVTPDRRRPPCR